MKSPTKFETRCRKWGSFETTHSQDADPAEETLDENGQYVYQKEKHSNWRFHGYYTEDDAPGELGNASISKLVERASI